MSAAAQTIDGRVAGNAQQPGFESRFGTPVRERLPGLDKGVLSNIQCMVRVAAQAPGKGVHPPLMLLHQSAERLAVSRLGASNKSVSLHVLSLLIPCLSNAVAQGNVPYGVGLLCISLDQSTESVHESTQRTTVRSLPGGCAEGDRAAGAGAATADPGLGTGGRGGCTAAAPGIHICGLCRCAGLYQSGRTARGRTRPPSGDSTGIRQGHGALVDAQDQRAAPQ